MNLISTNTSATVGETNHSLKREVAAADAAAIQFCTLTVASINTNPNYSIQSEALVGGMFLS